MTKRDGYQRYLDAGIAFTQMTRSRADELVQELVKSGEVQGKEARTKVEELIERSRKSSESLLSVVRDEVGNQLHSMGVSNIEDLAKQVASLLGRSSKAASGAARKSAKKAAPAKKAAAKKAPAKKAAAKKAPAKKRTPNAAFMKALTPSPQLAAVVGAAPLPRTEVVSKLWAYIKKNKLQDNVNKRMVNADAKLKEIFGKAQV